MYAAANSANVSVEIKSRRRPSILLKVEYIYVCGMAHMTYQQPSNPFDSPVWDALASVSEPRTRSRVAVPLSLARQAERAGKRSHAHPRDANKVTTYYCVHEKISVLTRDTRQTRPSSACRCAASSLATSLETRLCSCPSLQHYPEYPELSSRRCQATSACTDMWRRKS